jgi:hypothetical protein
MTDEIEYPQETISSSAAKNHEICVGYEKNDACILMNSTPVQRLNSRYTAVICMPDTEQIQNTFGVNTHHRIILKHKFFDQRIPGNLFKNCATGRTNKRITRGYLVRLNRFRAGEE